MMDQQPSPPEPVSPVAERVQPRGHSIFAWLAILGLVAFSIWFQKQRAREREVAEQKPDQLVETGPDPIMQVQGRMLVGMHVLFGGAAGDAVTGQLDGLNTGPIDHRICYAILQGELKSPKDALAALAELEQALQKYKPNVSPGNQRAIEILRRLYQDFEKHNSEPPDLSAADRDFLVQHLGWYGSLALAPASLDGNSPERRAVIAPAFRFATAALIGGAVVGALGLVGLIALAMVLILELGPRMWQRQEPLPYAGVYAETFALWLALFWLLNLAVPYIPAGRSSLLVNGLLDLLSLAALTWPVVRGVPWSQVRADVGLNFGRKPLVEPFAGLLCYVMSLPFLACGMMTVVVLMKLYPLFVPGTASEAEFGLGTQPTHPIVNIAAEADIWGKIQVYLLACVFAPILEETVFRGVLYRNLRGLTPRLGYWISVLFSAFVVSLVFAIIHPQGVLFAPALMSLAFGFALAREWRGTLVPGIIAHGLSNGLVMTLLVVGTAG